MSRNRFALIACCVLWMPRVEAESTVSFGPITDDPLHADTTVVEVEITTKVSDGVKDFHLRPPSRGSKFPPLQPYDGPTDTGDTYEEGEMPNVPGWLSVNHSGTSINWRAGANGEALGAGSEEDEVSVTLTLKFKGSTDSLNAAWVKWSTTTDNTNVGPHKWWEWPGTGQPPSPDTGKPGGVVTRGKSGAPAIPVFTALSGPGPLTIGRVHTITVDFGDDPPPSLTYTIYATLSETDPVYQVDVNDPIPASLGLELSTNSTTGTTIVGPGVVTAAYNTDRANHLLIDVPDDPELEGQVIYVQVVFGDGSTATPLELEITLPE